MKAMVLKDLGDLSDNPNPLLMEEQADPEPDSEEIVIRVGACGVCHTELDEIEGRTPPPRLPVVPGHQVVGRVEKRGSRAMRFARGERVGVAWIYSACGKCKFCLAGLENLCEQFRATGRDADGGYAELMKVREAFAYPIPGTFSDIEAAPLLCAGAIGYRSLRLAGIDNRETLGLTGFGASAHLVLKVVRHRWPRTRVFVFARSDRERQFARDLGAVWTGDTSDVPPEKLEAIVDTTPVWRPVVEALSRLERGGRLVVNAIRKEEADKSALLSLGYPEHLWLEKEIKTVANVTRRDVSEFLEIAAAVPIKPEVETYPLAEANRALLELKQGRIRGAKVLAVGRD
jgi:propanol-preferring alcohol dehydrogenase